jgi:hypothetical protein
MATSEQAAGSPPFGSGASPPAVVKVGGAFPLVGCHPFSVGSLAWNEWVNTPRRTLTVFHLFSYTAFAIRTSALFVYRSIESSSGLYRAAPGTSCRRLAIHPIDCLLWSYILDESNSDTSPERPSSGARPLLAHPPGRRASGLFNREGLQHHMDELLMVPSARIAGESEANEHQLP